MSEDRLPLSVREVLRVAREYVGAEQFDAAERWIRAGSYTTLTDTDLSWLRQYFIDTYDLGWATKYQLELVGTVPDNVLRWADTDRIMVCISCREVSDGQYSVTVIEDDGTVSATYCEDCADEQIGTTP